MIIRLLIMVALIAPISLWLRWRQSNRVCYMGPAQCVALVESGFAGMAYAILQIPDRADQTVVLVNKEVHFYQPSNLSISIVEECRFMQQPRITKVNWDERLVPTAPEFGSGVYISLLYLFMAFGIFLLTANEELSRFGGLSSGLAVALSGACFNLFRFSKKELRGRPTPFAGFLLERGILALSFGTAVLAALTVVCFWQFSVITFFPGSFAAFGLGLFCALLISATEG